MKFTLIKKVFQVVLSITIVQFYAQSQNIDQLKQTILTEKKTIPVLSAYTQLSNYWSTKNFDSCILVSRNGLVYAKAVKHTLTIAELEKNIGLAFYFKGNFDSAAYYYFTAINLLEKENNSQQLANTYNELAKLYRKKRQLDRALTYYNKALGIFTNLKDSAGIATILNESGVVFEYQENYAKALEKYNASLLIQEKRKDSMGISYSLSFIGGVYLLQRKFDEAENFTLKALEIRERIKDSFALSLTYADLGSIYKEQKKYAKASTAFIQSNSIAAHLNYAELQSSNYQQLANIATIQNNYKEANIYLLKHLQLKDSIFSLASAKSIEELSTKYETVKKDLEIQHKNFEIKKRNTWIVAIIILTVLSLLLALSFYRRYKLKKEKQLQEAVFKEQEIATKAILEAEENERKRIAGDLHDGIGQLMSAAKMNLSALEAEIPFANNEQRNVYAKVVNLVDESCKEVRTVSHNMMPNALVKAGLANAVREFINQIDIRVIKTDLYTEGLNERIDANIETVLYRVIQECVNNVIKHAQANHLDISLIKDADGIAITIEDNGKGFNAQQKNNFEGIGLKNIETRVKYLKGNVEWNAAIGKGTLVAIHIPTGS